MRKKQQKRLGRRVTVAATVVGLAAGGFLSGFLPAASAASAPAVDRDLVAGRVPSR
jgi:hypothetical protein